MTVGVLGGGQLARMLALAGRPLGRRFLFLEPASNPPVASLGEVVRGSYDDPVCLNRIAAAADVVTFEFEAVPAKAVRRLAAEVPVHPSPAALAAAQDRRAEKRLFQELGIPTARSCPVDGVGDLAAALAATGLPAVVKTRRFGYDGKGQAVVRSPEEAAAAVKALGPRLIAESFVDFERELSVLGAAGLDGSRVFYPLTENHHRDGLLRASYAPAPDVSAGLQAEAEVLAGKIMDRLGYVGVLAVELFQSGGRLLANEMAPRVHNSGHWTIDAAGASQFENHVRAVTGLALAPPAARGPTAMLNVIGEMPDLPVLAAVPGAHVHLYDKTPRPGRKLGHVNVTGPDAEAVMETAASVWRLLPGAGILPPPSKSKPADGASRRTLVSRPVAFAPELGDD